MAIFIIDGNNLSAALQKASLSAGGDDALVNLLRSWVHARQRRGKKAPDVRLFLDAGAASHPPAGLGVVTVRIAPHGVKADEAIVAELARLSGRAQRGEVVVVTSDRDLAERSRKLSAVVRNCPEFIAELLAATATREGKPSTQAEAPSFTPQEKRRLEAEFGVQPVATKTAPNRRIRRASDVASLTDAKMLFSVASDGPAWARRRAVRALAHAATPDAVRGLQALLTHRVPGVRAEAALALSTLRRPEVVAWLESLALDPYPLVRAAVARALKAAGSPGASATLGKLRQDPRSRVRRAVG